MAKEKLHSGGVMVDMTMQHRYLERLKENVLGAGAIKCEVAKIAADVKNKSVVKVQGKGFTPNTRVYINGVCCQSTFINDNEIEVPKPIAVTEPMQIMATNDNPLTLSKDMISQRNERLSITEVRPLVPLPLKTKQPFPLSISFSKSGKAKVQFCKFKVRFPDGTVQEQMYPVSSLENRNEIKIIENISIACGGSFECEVVLYDSNGNADYYEVQYPVVPSNPLQLYVYPEHGAPSGSGAAIYNSSNDRYYCHSRWVISNGNNFDVTIGPNIRCRVSDSGLGELADFNFNISTSVIPANSTRTIYIYTWHGSGSDPYNLFKKFGDAKYEFWLDTSTGQISNWNVWAASAQVGVTANFVGNFSNAERIKVRDIIDSHASAIYSKVDCIFKPNTPILEIASSHPDWHTYRDIHVEETKSGVCTDSDEADDLLDDWSAPSEYNDRIDIFFVESFSGAPCASSLGGFSPVDGPTSKGGSDSGIVIDVKDLNILTSSWGEQVLGVVIAHEVAHYLGIEGHSSAANNFMNTSVGPNNTNIAYSQWKTMRDHDFVKMYNPS